MSLKSTVTVNAGGAAVARSEIRSCPRASIRYSKRRGDRWITFGSVARARPSGAATVDVTAKRPRTARAAGADLVGGAIITARKKWDARVLDAALALGAGFMLAAVLLDIVPASLATRRPALPALVLAGYLIVHLAQRTVAPHHHHGEDAHHHGPACGGVRLCSNVGLSALAGFMIHTFFDGVSIGAGFAVSSSLGMLVFVAVILHKVPEGITLASIVLASGSSRRRAFGATCLVGFATVAGALLTGTLAGQYEHDALAVAGGVMLYVATSTLVPEVTRARGRGSLLFLTAGALLFAVTDRLLQVAGFHG